MATYDPAQCAEEVEKALEGHMNIGHSLPDEIEMDTHWYRDLRNPGKPVPEGQPLTPIVAVALTVQYPSLPVTKSRKSSWMMPDMRGWCWCKIHNVQRYGSVELGIMCLISGIPEGYVAADIRHLLFPALGEEAEVLDCCVEAVPVHQLSFWISRQEAVLLRALIGFRLQKTKEPRYWKGDVTYAVKSLLSAVLGKHPRLSLKIDDQEGLEDL